MDRWDPPCEGSERVMTEPSPGGGEVLWWLPPEGAGGEAPHQADLDQRAQLADQADQ